jgi:hypothetical protein
MTSRAFRPRGTRRLSRPASEGPSVRVGGGAPRTHVEGGLGRRVPCPGRGGVGSGPHQGTAPCVRRRCQRPARWQRHDGRRRAQAPPARARRRRAAPAHPAPTATRVWASTAQHRAERRIAEQAETGYRRLIADWAGHRPNSRCERDTGARIANALEGQGRAAGHKLVTPALRHVGRPHLLCSLPQGARRRQAV